MAPHVHSIRCFPRSGVRPGSKNGHFQNPFLDASSHLYMRVCPSVGRFVCIGVPQLFAQGRQNLDFSPTAIQARQANMPILGIFFGIFTFFCLNIFVFPYFSLFQLFIYILDRSYIFFVFYLFPSLVGGVLPLSWALLSLSLSLYI